MRKTTGLVLVAALAAGCEGRISEGTGPGAAGGPGTSTGAAGTGGDTPHPPVTTPADQMKADMMMQAANPDVFALASKYFPSTDLAVAPKRMSRLTRTQLDLSAKSLLPAFTGATALATIPPDPLQTNYEYAANLGFNAANFTPYQKWVDGIAAAVRAKPASLIDCAAQSNAATCLQAEAKKLAARAFRGTATDAQLQRFADFYATSFTQVGAADAAADLVTMILMSPSFAYRDEVQTDAAGFLLPAQRLANLTYTLADAPPETVGLSSASPASSLQSTDAVQQTIDKILATPEARAKLTRFFMSWLEVKDVPEYTIDPGTFPEFTPAVAAAAIEETRAFLTRQLAGAAPTLKGITQSTQSFVTQSLASLYGVKNPSATNLVDLDPAQRLGIFTQPAVIASHSGPTTTRLVKRGVFFVRKVMCMPLGNPPAGTDTSIPANATGTERQRIQAVTAQSPCSACHAAINPFGFMQENYDAIGRWRATDEEGLAIDPSIDVAFLDEGRLAAKTPVEALKGFTASARFKQCFARQMFRFYTGRDELAADDPVLRKMFFDFANNDEQAIVRLLQTLGNAPAFSQRKEAP